MIDSSPNIGFVIAKEVQQQCEFEGKILVLQELAYDNGMKELRLGYYMIGYKPRMRGRWTWGESCAFFNAREFTVLMEKAKEKGML